MCWQLQSLPDSGHNMNSNFQIQIQNYEGIAVSFQNTNNCSLPTKIKTYDGGKERMQFDLISRYLCVMKKIISNGLDSGKIKTGDGDNCLEMRAYFTIKYFKISL